MNITIRDILTTGKTRLENSGITDTPYLDALILLCSVLHYSKEKLLASLPDPIWESDALIFHMLLEKRIQGIPVAYILHRKEFYGRNFYVDDRVLIPRPDTETLIEYILSLEITKKPISILDLCTGSGCIGITLKAELPQTDVTLSDISIDALAVAEVNARELLIPHTHVSVIQSNLFETIQETYDIIATNPPYVSPSDCKNPELIARGEPGIALCGGDVDGLKIIRTIIIEGIAHLRINGYLVIECGYDQAVTVSTLMKESGYREIIILKDLEGRDRIVAGKKEG